MLCDPRARYRAVEAFRKVEDVVGVNMSELFSDSYSQKGKTCPDDEEEASSSKQLIRGYR